MPTTLGSPQRARARPHRRDAEHQAFRYARGCALSTLTNRLLSGCREVERWRYNHRPVHDLRRIAALRRDVEIGEGTDHVLVSPRVAGIGVKTSPISSLQKVRISRRTYGPAGWCLWPWFCFNSTASPQFSRRKESAPAPWPEGVAAAIPAQYSAHDVPRRPGQASQLRGQEETGFWRGVSSSDCRCHGYGYCSP
jgi:hypothetical protein